MASLVGKTLDVVEVNRDSVILRESDDTGIVPDSQLKMYMIVAQAQEGPNDEYFGRLEFYELAKAVVK